METVFKHRKVGRIAVAGLVSGAAIWSAPLPVQAAVAPVTSVVFNNPNDAVKKTAVSDRLRSLIAGADANSTIKVAIYMFQDPSITDALRRARSRGVSVQVIVDWVSTQYPTWKDLSDPTLGGLGFDRTKSSWVFSCPASQACIGGTNAPADVKPLMHNKFALFSSVGGARDVVFQSSANFKDYGSGDGNWNNAVTSVGNSGLYQSYAGYFDDLKNLRRNTDYYNTRPPQTFGAFRPYYSPRGGSGADTDTIVSILNNVDCTKRNTSTGTSTGQTIVKVAMASFTRGDVSEKLKQMDNSGCYVQVIYRDDTVGAEVKADLLDKSGRYNGIQSWRFPDSFKDKETLHSKYLAIEGYYYGASNQKWVWTGSHNYTRPALRYNDEVLLRVAGASFHDAFRQNFRDMAYGAPGILANQ